MWEYSLITGDIKSKVDKIWDSFWTGGVSNPLEVMEQITYLLFIKRLDDLHTLEENKANRTNKPMERRTFPEGKDPRKRSYEDLRWSRFKHFEPKEMFDVMAEHVFPFLRTLGGDDSTYAHHMKDARFTIPTPALLAKVVDMIDGVPMEDRDTKGDLYEYMLGKIATAGQNGQFRTPRHEIQLMVELVKPVPTDVMCDPASGTCGFPVAVGEYLRENHSEIFRDNKLRKHFHHELFNAFDFDSTMLRIGSMNMLLHGVEKRRAALALLDELTQSIFLDMFGDAEARDSQWPVRKIEEYVCEFQGGKSLVSDEDMQSKNRVLKVSAVTSMKFIANESKPIPDSYDPPKHHFVSPNDLLFSRANTTELVGAVAYVSHCPSNLVLPDKLWRFVWRNPDEIHPLFVWYLFQTPPVRREIGNRATGTSGSMKNISKAKLFGIKTILPSFKLQKDFADRVQTVEAVKIDLRDSLKAFDSLFASLQHRAFRGEL